MVQTSNPVKIAFLFTGQGSQYPQMGKICYDQQPLFRQVLEECDTLTRSFLNPSLLDVLYFDSSQQTLIHQTLYTQAALFSLEYALSELLKSWEIIPEIVMGHSLGEYSAACAAGIMSWQEGLKLVAKRASLMQKTPLNGKMRVVIAAEESVAEALQPYADCVAIAAINGPKNIVISGESSVIELLDQFFQSRGILTQPLNVSHAFHSPFMDPILDEFENEARQFFFRPPQLPCISNLTGTLMPHSQPLDAVYWRRHLREPVQFLSGIKTLENLGVEMIIEVGPQAVLSGLTRKCLLNKSIQLISTLE